VSQARPDPRTVERVRLAVVLGAGAAFALAYGLYAELRSEVDRAAAILGRGNVTALRDYILSFGGWAPVVSGLLMILQALVSPLPAFLVT
jgi:uncharacterized membrane protein YdjX (TVP38/TMEM64 family)